MPSDQCELLAAVFFHAHASGSSVIREEDLEAAAIALAKPKLLRELREANPPGEKRTAMVHQTLSGLSAAEQSAFDALIVRARAANGERTGQFSARGTRQAAVVTEPIPLLTRTSSGEGPLELAAVGELLIGLFHGGRHLQGVRAAARVEAMLEMERPLGGHAHFLARQIGADFERGLVRAVGASNEALDARAAIGGSRPTSLNALSILMRALVSIDLRDNRITDLEASGLASGLRLAVSLSKLYLSGNRISSSGAKELGKALVTSGKSAKSVADLDLSRNPLGSSGGRPSSPSQEQQAAAAGSSSDEGSLRLRAPSLLAEY